MAASNASAVALWRLRQQRALLCESPEFNMLLNHISTAAATNSQDVRGGCSCCHQATKLTTGPVPMPTESSTGWRPGCLTVPALSLKEKS
jgi:hypothetical protein